MKEWRQVSSFCDLLDDRRDQPAFYIGQSSATRGELRSRASAAARYLAKLGLRRGDAIALWLPDGAAWLQLIFAAAEMGVLVVPVSTRYRLADAQHVVSTARAKAIIICANFLDIDFVGMAEQIRTQLDCVANLIILDSADGFFDLDDANPPFVGGGQPTDPLCTFSTSGTTGMPKLAVHVQGSIVLHSRNVVAAFDIRPGDVMLCALPLYGVLGFIQTFSAIAGKAACVFLPVFNAAEAARLIDHYKVTHFFGSDAMISSILEVPGTSLASWRCGGFAEFAGLGKQITEAAEERSGLRLTGLYGSSECYALMTRQSPEQDTLSRAINGGRPIAEGIEVRVADVESGKPLPDGLPGELQVRGYNVMSGYLHNREATKAALTEDGWFKTGDLAHMHTRGIVFLARMNDSLRIKGYLVDPSEIENQLIKYDDVLGAQVVGVKRQGQSDVAVAFVRTKNSNLSEAELFEFCRKDIASFKIPTRILFVADFPQVHGPNGSKVLKSKLREMANSVISSNVNNELESADGQKTD